MALDKDSNIKLLLHMDGSGANFVDSGYTEHTITAHGNATQSSAYPTKFNQHLSLDGYSDCLSAPAHNNWYFGTDLFTIDFWVMFFSLPSSGSYATFVSQFDDVNNYWVFELYNDSGTYKLKWHIIDASDDFSFSKTWTTPVINTWYHVALIRGWGGNSDSWAVTVDGTILESATTETDDVPELSGNLEIGAIQTIVNELYGRIAEFCIREGAAWTANFTPNDFQYSASGVWINIDDEWKYIEEIKINIGDSWKDVSSIKLNIGDVWKNI